MNKGCLQDRGEQEDNSEVKKQMEALRGLHMWEVKTEEKRKKRWIYI